MIYFVVDFSLEGMEAIRPWGQHWETICQPGVLYPVKISFRNENKIKAFCDEEKLREFVTTEPALRRMLKKVFQGDN